MGHPHAATNPEVIAVNQDRLGTQASRVSKEGDIEFWRKPLSGGRHALGVLNRGKETRAVTARWADLGLKPRQRVRDLWAKRDLGLIGDSISLDVPSHATALLRLASA